jgi:hypothetical protein
MCEDGGNPALGTQSFPKGNYKASVFPLGNPNLETIGMNPLS